jgi:hypothetical protein
VAEPAWHPDPAEELLEELATFADDDTDGLARLAEQLRELRSDTSAPEFDLEAIWASVERQIDLGPPASDPTGGSENG